MHPDLLSKFGVSDTAFTDDFGGCVLGRTLIMDGDAACYRASATAAKLATAQRRFSTLIYEAMFLTKAQFARVHITPKDCFKNGRHLLLGVKPYQGNRAGKAKPVQLEPLRYTAPSLFHEHENISVFGHYSIEADDGIMQDAYSIENSIVWSEDKDLNIVPCTKYDINTGIEMNLTPNDRFGWVDMKHTEAGIAKAVGHGTKFFWLQMLFGDSADNVKGLLKLDGKDCGLKGALQYLTGITNEHHCANLVLNAYRAINQNFIPEAEALWLTRVPNDTACNYIWSLDLTPINREYFKECFQRKWKLTEAEYAARCEDQKSTND